MKKLWYVERSTRVFVFTDEDITYDYTALPRKIREEISENINPETETILMMDKKMLAEALERTGWDEDSCVYGLGSDGDLTVAAAYEITQKSLVAEALERRGIRLGDYVKVTRRDDLGTLQDLRGFIVNSTAEPVRAHDVWVPELRITVWSPHEHIVYLNDGHKPGARVRALSDDSVRGEVVACDPLYARVRWDGDLPKALKVTALPYCDLMLIASVG